ncbi:sarcosine oxidase subunit gamma [Enteractinococcus fodinae]|uniref:Sarcosine oxidase subunit gamma n=1 Tax=Enteractinococcus fodinae TaxID=684663 RepID=A0ABU2AYH6_9MICC|nr:sarcosine oxidase subunit gamma family protein [Enteractinococcus fodinae]MDR7346409.1 sarcosine oxidase subunit gamma [Enteractinococcus fodinae]
MVNTKPDPRALRESPLQHLAGELAQAEITGPQAVAIREIPFATMIGIRAIPGSAAHEAITDVLPDGLPAGVGQVAGDPDGIAVLWISPDEFLAISLTERPELFPTLETALGDERGHVVDLTSNRTIVELSGPAAHKALRKGTPTDIHPRVFTVNRAITTTLARTPVLLWKTGETTWRILPRASFAEHIAYFLMDAMHEFDYQLID